MSRYLALTLTLVCWFSLLSLTASAEDSLYSAWSGPGPSSNATASYLGATGLLITPTAMITPPLRVNGYFHEIRSDPHQSFYGATLGLPGGLEISGTRLQKIEPLPGQPNQDRDETVVNAKYQIPIKAWLVDAFAPKVAVGVFDAGNEVNRTYYLTVSRSFSLTQKSDAPLNLHVGWGHPNKDDTRLDGFFGGIDFAPFSKALVQVEYDAKDLNAGARFYPVPWLSLDAGVVANDFAWGLTLRSNW